MDIEHISVSRRKTFKDCAQKYKFRYHLRLPQPGPEPFYFVYGTIVHKIAELYVTHKGGIPIAELAKEVIQGKYEIENGTFCPTIPDDYKRKLQKHLKAIHNLTEKIGTDGFVEKKFKYDLDPPNNRCITGFIDRLILREDKAFIIDYKTTKKGKWRVNKQTVKDDLQLRVYSRVIQREFGLPAENIKAALFYLEGEELVACQYSEQSLIQTEQDLLNAYLEIEQSDPDKVWGRVGWHCKNCEYQTLCPFYNPQSAEQASWSGSLEDLGHNDPWA